VLHTDRTTSERNALVESASTWMQVVFGGVGVTVAIVALVIGYFAWVQPHSPDGNTGPTVTSAARPTSTSGPSHAGRTVALTELTPSVGGSNLHRSGNDLVMPCASGGSTDRQRVAEYELADRYLAITATLTVSKAPDADSQLQVRVFADEQQAANVTLTKGTPTSIDVPLSGKEKLKIQLTCQSRDSGITIGTPTMTHA
jgi:hypothetical protein